MLSAVVISQLSSGPAWPAAEFCYTQSHRAPTPGGRRQVITQALCSLTHTHAKGSFPVKLLIDSAFDLMKSYNPLSSCLDVDIFRSEWHYCKLQSSPPPFHCLLCKEDEAQRTSLPLCVFVVIFPNFLHNNVPQAILCAVMHWKRANLNTKIRDLRWGRAAGGGGGREWVSKSCVMERSEEQLPLWCGLFLMWSLVCWWKRVTWPRNEKLSAVNSQIYWKTWISKFLMSGYLTLLDLKTLHNKLSLGKSTQNCMTCFKLEIRL